MAAVSEVPEFKGDLNHSPEVLKDTTPGFRFSSPLHVAGILKWFSGVNWE